VVAKNTTKLKGEENHLNRLSHIFQVVDMVWLHLSKQWIQHTKNKIKPIRYGPFEIV